MIATIDLSLASRFGMLGLKSSSPGPAMNARAGSIERSATSNWRPLAARPLATVGRGSRSFRGRAALALATTELSPGLLGEHVRNHVCAHTGRPHALATDQATRLRRRPL